MDRRIAGEQVMCVVGEEASRIDPLWQGNNQKRWAGRSALIRLDKKKNLFYDFYKGRSNTHRFFVPVQSHWRFTSFRYQTRFFGSFRLPDSGLRL